MVIVWKYSVVSVYAAPVTAGAERFMMQVYYVRGPEQHTRGQPDVFNLLYPSVSGKSHD